MTRPFLVLWCSTLLFYLGFQLLLPVVPLYAAALGAREAHVGFIMGSFALAAMVPRPIAGDLADRIGRRPLVLLGTAIFMLAPVGYALVGAIPGLLVVRLFHGAGMGFGPTAATVIATDLTPPPSGARRWASTVWRRRWRSRSGRTPEGSSCDASASGRRSSWRPRSRPSRSRSRGRCRKPDRRPVLCTRLLAPPDGAPGGALARFWRRWFSTAAVYPSALVLSLYVSYGGLAALLPLFAERRQLGNPGLFYTVYALVGLAVRSPAGWLSDRLGRRAVIAPALGSRPRAWRCSPSPRRSAPSSARQRSTAWASARRSPCFSR